MDKQKITILGGAIGGMLGYAIHPDGKTAYECSLLGAFCGSATIAAYFAYASLKNTHNVNATSNNHAKSNYPVSNLPAQNRNVGNLQGLDEIVLTEEIIIRRRREQRRI